MATVIQIKRSTSGLAPNTSVLAEAELAYSQDKSNDGGNAILYIESVDNSDNPVIHKVGGKYYTDLLDTATDVDTELSIVKRDADANFSANTITANLFIGSFFGTIDGTANAATQLATPRLINLAGDLEGNVLFDGSSDVTIFANVFANGVELGTDTTGDYVANLTAGTGIDVTGFAGETSTLTVALADTAVSPGYYGGAASIPVINVDQQGRITLAANASISTTLNIEGDSGSNALSLINDTLDISGSAPGIFTDVTNNIVTITNTGVTEVTSAGHGIVASASTGNVQLTFTGVGSVSGTTNEVTVDASTGNVTIGLPSDVTIQNDLTVSGNLNVLGTAVTVGVENFVVNDPLIHLANNNTSSDLVDIGFEGHYFDSTFGDRHAGLFRDASDNGIFKLFANVSVELENETTVDTENAGFTIATLVANLTGANVSNLLNPIAVADGGTGRITLTANAVLYGDGTNAVALATGSSGEILQIGTDGAVTFAGIDGGTY